MSRRWQKRGLLFEPRRIGDWSVTHAMLPIAEPRGDGHRLYFSARDGRGRASIGRAHVDLAGGRVTEVEAHPLISPGPLGAFDDSGVTTACLVEHDGDRYLYYTGWSLGVTVPFYLFAGLAISRDGGRTFERASPSPILERSRIDPFLTTSPSVIVEDGRWRMWYVSGVDWIVVDAAPRHRYHIRYAESDDGIRWRPTGRVCLDFASADEYAFGRPTVVKDGGLYRMWYCVRGDAYRLGYAESRDGLEWARLDRQAGLDVTPGSWDGEMIAYPSIATSGGRQFLLYNGNGYGRTGIGMAEATTGEPRPASPRPPA